MSRTLLHGQQPRGRFGSVWQARETLTATLQGSLKRANFAGSNLQGVTLFGADLMEANFTGANV